MLKDYTGPGADDVEGEIVHRFIGELLDDCDVLVNVPDIDGDKSYYRIMRKMQSGRTVEVLIQGWDLESIAEDCRFEKREYAEDILEKLVRNRDDVNIDDVIEKFSFMMEISDRISGAKADIDDQVGERFRKLMYDRICQEARKANNGRDGIGNQGME